MANRDAKLIERTLKDFSLGAMSGNGGSVIVDALPAKGVEGTTYLLRKKEESEVFKAHGYLFMYSTVQSETPWPFGSELIMIDADLNTLEKDITTKLNPDLSQGLVDFNYILEIGGVRPASVSSDDWNAFIETNNVAIVKTEEEVSKITKDVDYIVQDLGEIGVENLKIIEMSTIQNPQQEVEYLAAIYSELGNLLVKTTAQDDELIRERRDIEFNSEIGPDQTKYSFTEWETIGGGNIIGTFTDKYEYDNEVLAGLLQPDCYFITLTPVVPEVTYSYTEYVFDQGVYTLLGEGGGSLYTIQVKGRTGGVEPRNCSFTVQVDSKDIHTCQDLINYLTDKGYYFSWSSGEGQGFILQATGMVGSYKVTGIYTYSGDFVSVLSTSVDGADLNPETVEITYLGE